MVVQLTDNADIFDIVVAHESRYHLVVVQFCTSSVCGQDGISSYNTLAESKRYSHVAFYEVSRRNGGGGRKVKKMWMGPRVKNLKVRIRSRSNTLEVDPLRKLFDVSVLSLILSMLQSPSESSPTCCNMRYVEFSYHLTIVNNDARG